MLNVNGLRILAELDRLGTVTAVARSMSYSPSAVSQQLSQLEREAGVPLLEKVGRGVRLTDAATGLVGHAQAILERLEQAESDLAAAGSGVRGVLRGASFQTALLILAPPALTLLGRDHPDLQVQLVHREISEAYAGLLAHGFDVIVGEKFEGVPEPRRSGVDQVDLLDDELLLALPPAGPWSSPNTLADLADAPWALDPEPTTMGIWARTMLRESGIEPRVHFETPDPLLQTHLVRSGHAVAVIPALIVAEHLTGTTLRSLPGHPRRRLFTAARSGRIGHPAIQAFRRALVAAAEQVQVDAPAPVLNAVPGAAGGEEPHRGRNKP